LIQALRVTGLLKTPKPTSTGWWDITCPQVHEHTDQVDNGTAVMIRSDGSWTLKCQHGHCADLKPQNLYDLLVEQGQSLPHPLQRDPQILCADFDVIGESTGLALTTENPRFKPIIKLKPGELPQVMGVCAELLRDVVFKRGGQLVRIGLEPVPHTGPQKITPEAHLKPVTANWLKRELTERAAFLRWDARSNGWFPTDCPTLHAKALEDGTDDKTFKRLTALTTVPFLREDGSVFQTPGYDEATGIYFQPAMEFPKLPDAPSYAQARAALEVILELVKQFPFANKASRSVFLADVLTALARPTLSKSPMVLYTASMAGSGKTLMASIANLIAYGHVAYHSWPNSSEEELRKVFTTVLLAGDSVLVFDNVPNGQSIQSAALAQFVTSEQYAGRILGVNERVLCVNRTRIVLTGNNVTLASDNARRALVCSLQLNVESVKDRQVQFEHPALSTHVKLNRARYVMAGLTVLRAYALHTQRLSLKPLDSFEEWSQRVREPLVWLGEEDPVTAVDYSNDGSAELGAAFKAIYQAIDGHLESRIEEFEAKDLAKLAGEDLVLRDALFQAGCREPQNSNSLGYWLRQYKNRIASGYQLTDKKQTSGGVNTWKLTSTSKETLEFDASDFI
jgi:putative DNA primase/helicase